MAKLFKTSTRSSAMTKNRKTSLAFLACLASASARGGISEPYADFLDKTYYAKGTVPTMESMLGYDREANYVGWCFGTVRDIVAPCFLYAGISKSQFRIFIYGNTEAGESGPDRTSFEKADALNYLDNMVVDLDSHTNESWYSDGQEAKLSGGAYVADSPTHNVRFSVKQFGAYFIARSTTIKSLGNAIEGELNGMAYFFKKSQVKGRAYQPGILQGHRNGYFAYFQAGRYFQFPHAGYVDFADKSKIFTWIHAKGYPYFGPLAGPGHRGELPIPGQPYQGDVVVIQ